MTLTGHTPNKSTSFSKAIHLKSTRIMSQALYRNAEMPAFTLIGSMGSQVIFRTPATSANETTYSAKASLAYTPVLAFDAQPLRPSLRAAFKWAVDAFLAAFPEPITEPSLHRDNRSANTFLPMFSQMDRSLKASITPTVLLTPTLDTAEFSLIDELQKHFEQQASPLLYQLANHFKATAKETNALDTAPVPMKLIANNALKLKA